MPKSSPPRRTVALHPNAPVGQQRPRPEWPSDGVTFREDCTLCPRLAAFLKQGRAEYPGYYCAPVPPFGDPKARLVIVGLAPGFHGANATARPFTGDHAGILLYRTLHRFGFANRAESIHVGDGFKLINARISNSVKCVPPGNKPLPVEIRTCNRYLEAELKLLPAPSVFVALGSVAHASLLQALKLKGADYKFGHAAEYTLPGGHVLIDSYHCSRYNTQTRRLTDAMFEDIFRRAAEILAAES